MSELNLEAATMGKVSNVFLDTMKTMAKNLESYTEYDAQADGYYIGQLKVKVSKNGPTKGELTVELSQYSEDMRDKVKMYFYNAMKRMGLKA